MAVKSTSATTQGLLSSDAKRTLEAEMRSAAYLMALAGFSAKEVVDVVKSYRAGWIARNQTGQVLSGDRSPGPSQPSPSQPSPPATKSPKRGPAYSRRLAVRLKRREDAKQAATIRDAAIARKTPTDETRQITRANPTEQVTDAARKMAPGEAERSTQKANPAGQVENATPQSLPMPNSPPGYSWHLVSMYQPSPTTVVAECTLAPTMVQSGMPSPYMPGPYHAHMPHAPSYHAPCNYGPVAFAPARP